MSASIILWLTEINLKILRLTTSASQAFSNTIGEQVAHQLTAALLMRKT